ncbi:class I SAM-dependent methyltransferase [Algoriphagus aestuarii]|nr:class I SAM-dependent methyltransferase [Algoriphagus aestuarii]
MKDDYSFIAPYYNRLAKLVFGKKLKEAKNCFVSGLEDKKILLIGGGDGLDYQEIAKKLHGQYWEKSQRMLELAKRNLSESGLSFHLGEFKVENSGHFDEVWLHFVLDTMEDSEISQLISVLRSNLKANGRVYLVDFFEAKSFWQKGMLQVMLGFFRIFAAHKRKNIPDYEKLFLQAGWIKSTENDLMDGWVCAQIWTHH